MMSPCGHGRTEEGREMYIPRMKMIAVVCGMLFVTACQNNGAGQEGNGITPIDTPDTGGDTDMSPGPNVRPNSTSNSDPMADMGQDLGQEDMDDDEEMGEEEEGLCQELEDRALGLIAPGTGTLSLSGSTIDRDFSYSATTCGFSSAPELAYTFRVDTPMRVKASLRETSLPLVLEVRRGACGAATSILCSPTPRTFAALPGEEFVIVVEARQNNRGTFTLDLEFEDLVCLPTGNNRCEGDDLIVCEGGLNETTAVCGEPCGDVTCFEGDPCGVACGGDLCSNAIAIPSFPYRFEGEHTGYRSLVSFARPNSCTNPDDEGSPDPIEISTPGEEVFFALPALNAGQILKVDATRALGNQGDSVIAIVSDCEDLMSCSVIRDLGDSLTWTVPEKGNYKVILDRRTLDRGEIVVDFSIE